MIAHSGLSCRTSTPAGSWLLYCLLNLASAAFVWRMVPETEGLTLEEIHLRLRGQQQVLTNASRRRNRVVPLPSASAETSVRKESMRIKEHGGVSLDIGGASQERVDAERDDDSSG